MIQAWLLIILIVLCILLIISIFKKPFEEDYRNPCRFKITPPKYTFDGDKKQAEFTILVEKEHRYFINFPILFRFYSEGEFRSLVKIYYTIPGDQKQKLLERDIEFKSKTKEHIVYITDVILGKIIIELDLYVINGDPIIGFEIMTNTTCDMVEETKLEIIFPKNEE